MDQKGNSGRKIRVAYLMHGIFYGGASRSLFLLLKSVSGEPLFHKTIYTISVGSEEVETDLLKYADDIKTVKLKTISINQVHKDPYLVYKLNSIKSCRKFVELMIADGIDILHINTSVFPQIPFWVKKYSDIKVVTHLREFIDPQNKSSIADYMIRNITNYSDGLIAISENEALPFKKHSNLIILPNPFDFSKNRATKDKPPALLNIAEKEITVTMLSHFSRLKGHINFLKALACMADHYPPDKPFRFIIVGYKGKRPLWKRVVKLLLLNKDYTQEVLDFISNNNLGEKIILIPYTNDIFGLLNNSDIIVRPADSADPWGRDIIEAMAFKKPVIATGYSEFYIKNGITGFLVPPKNAEILAEKISELISDDLKRKKFGEAGYLLIKEMCDLDNYGKRILGFYKSMLKTQLIEGV